MSKQRITFEAWLENNMSPEFSSIEKDGKRAFRRLDNEIDDVNNSLSTADSKMVTLTRRLGAAAAGYFAIDKITDWGGAIVDSTSKYQRFNAVLENTLGSKAGAQNAMSRIQDFAASTPFQIDELTDSFVKLSNQGFVPNMKNMRSLGDLAASTGKGYDQLTEAIIDAQTGEFERLKEFGIRASKSGDQVTFTFKNQKTTVDFTADSIRKYVLGLGDAAGVSGAMAKISATTGGKISNLSDQIDGLNKNLGDRYKNAIDTSIMQTSKFIGTLSRWAEIPLSEKMEQQRLQTNLLVGEINSLNTTEDDRLRIYTQLREINPDLVAGMSAQNIVAGKLYSNLQKYNAEQLKSISLQKVKEALDSQSEKRLNQATRFYDASGSTRMGYQGAIDELIKLNPSTGTFIDKVLKNYYSDADIRSKESASLSNRQRNTLSRIYSPGKNEFQIEKSLLNEVLTFLEIELGDTKSYKKAQSVWNKNYRDLTGAPKVYNAYDLLVKKSEEEYKNLAEQWGLSISADPEPDPNPNPNPFSGSGSASSVLGGISGDNRNIKNISINIDKLGAIEKAEFRSQEDEEDLSQFMEKLRTGLMIVLNDTNTMVN